MNQKRKAELQRKLSMTSVPRPPAGLSDRIKADIPHDLMSTDRDREHLSRSTAFTMRVAASILLLISAAYLSVQLISRSEHKTNLAPLTQARAAKEAPAAAPQAAPAAPPAEVTIALAEEPKAKLDRAVIPGRRDDVSKIAKDEKKDEKREAGIADRLYAPTPAAPPPPPPSAAVAGAEPTPAEPAAKSMADLQARGAMRTESIAVNAAAPAIVKSASANEFSFAAPRAIFGISIDPTAFDRVKRSIEQGEKPAAGSVDVAALVNYFAGSARPPRRDVRFDVEASRAPLAESDTALIRFTVDTPHEDVAPGASVPPVATGADLEITLNSNAVASHRLIGAEELKTQATLMKNMSVTGMLDMKLKPHVPPRTIVATLTLRYRSVEDGKRKTIPQTVLASDLTRTWASATRRHRLATLGAVWSESLNEGGAASDVAKTAEKLAGEAPDDARARELATLASAFSRLQTSGPTGSGR